jgi:hypothetical protein
MCPDTSLRTRLPAGSWLQFVVPAGIQAQFCHRLGAPIRTRPHNQSFRAHSTVLLRQGIGPAYFHGSWCPWGMRVLSQSSIFGQNPKFECQKMKVSSEQAPRYQPWSKHSRVWTGGSEVSVGESDPQRFNGLQTPKLSKKQLCDRIKLRAPCKATAPGPASPSGPGPRLPGR